MWWIVEDFSVGEIEVVWWYKKSYQIKNSEIWNRDLKGYHNGQEIDVQA